MELRLAWWLAVALVLEVNSVGRLAAALSLSHKKGVNLTVADEGTSNTEDVSHKKCVNLTVAAEGTSNKTEDVLSRAVSPLAPNCNSANTVWDVGLHHGSDSVAYMQAGFCVVGVEADPEKAAKATHTFQAQISTGQLAVVNAALPPAAAPGQDTSLPFYRNRCSGEWNSFDRAQGCKGGEAGGCDAPFAYDKGMCDVIPVPVTPCSHLFQWYGRPLYAKLDIAGAETGCFQAMRDLGGKAATWNLPPYLSAEIGSVGYVDELYSLGYTHFKLVRQDVLFKDGATHSGPWGSAAVDCRTGHAWRTYESVRAEMVLITAPLPNGTSAEMAQAQSMASPCPRIGIGKCWYDLHVKLDRKSVV